jgi:hypothetical protein
VGRNKDTPKAKRFNNNNNNNNNNNKSATKRSATSTTTNDNNKKKRKKETCEFSLSLLSSTSHDHLVHDTLATQQLLSEALHHRDLALGFRGRRGNSRKKANYNAT